MKKETDNEPAPIETRFSRNYFFKIECFRHQFDKNILGRAPEMDLFNSSILFKEWNKSTDPSTVGNSRDYNQMEIYIWLDIPQDAANLFSFLINSGNGNYTTFEFKKLK
jgi:hypothetical protein